MLDEKTRLRLIYFNISFLVSLFQIQGDTVAMTSKSLIMPVELPHPLESKIVILE